MVFKALSIRRIANSAISRTIKEWYDATLAQFKHGDFKAGHVPFEWAQHLLGACESEAPHMRLLFLMQLHVG